jgi:fido (protein-threonine AMPylation protein)
MPDYKWKPIESISEQDREIDLAAMKPLYETWKASRARLESASPANLEEFNKRLIRRLSIETGILERLYELDRGTTEALVAKGFVEDLISRSSTDIEPSRLIDILSDHEGAIQLVMDCVSGQRELTKSVIHELHAILTRHQDTTVAIDQFGKRFEIPLLKGRFKQHPNNPKRADDSLHEYCPPIHVESEMDNLLKWFDENSHEDPIVLAAWFHHRFTQIHPYQDGNGRVGRALTTLTLLRAELLPLVIDRDLRTEYIGALEQADAGELSALAGIFARLERTAIMQALSIDADAEISHQKTVTAAVIDTLSDRFGKRKHAKLTELRRVNEVATALREGARSYLSDALNRLAEAVSKIAVPDLQVANGGTDHGNGHWYKFEVVTTASANGKFANFGENHYFIKAWIRAERERLVFVLSFHHIGRELSGIMEATAFAKLESYEDSEERRSVSQDFFVCSLEPFVFTFQTDSQQISGAFSRWLDSSLAIAIKEYGDRL